MEKKSGKVFVATKLEGGGVKPLWPGHKKILFFAASLNMNFFKIFSFYF